MGPVSALTALGVEFGFSFFAGEEGEEFQLEHPLQIKKIAENYKIPYFTITPSFSICPIHGYISGEHDECPFEISDSGEVSLPKKSDGGLTPDQLKILSA